MPGPIPPSLDLHLNEVLARIPSGQRGQVSATVTTQGLAFGAAQKLGTRGSIAGWAGREKGVNGWGGWSAGARGSFSW